MQHEDGHERGDSVGVGAHVVGGDVRVKVKQSRAQGERRVRRMFSVVPWPLELDSRIQGDGSRKILVVRSCDGTTSFLVWHVVEAWSSLA